ncbi:MAG: hypothetical protein JRJ85_28260, partial [Deltaproteobacteria bacterium]|nr:hypothetical protein [Deltaproteobacteria bacterium]
RVYVPQDAHSWGKEYESIARDGYDIGDYAPLALPATGTRHLFASTTLEDGSTNNPDLDRPLLRVLPHNTNRIWDWVAKERPVCDNSLEKAAAGGGSHPGHPDYHSEYEDLVTTYAVLANKFGSDSPGNIDGAGNPHGQDDNYLTAVAPLMPAAPYLWPQGPMLWNSDTKRQGAATTTTCAGKARTAWGPG